MDTLHAELIRLKSRLNRLQTFLFVSLLIVSVCVCAGAAAINGTIRGTKFELVNDLGQVVGSWESVEAGSRLELRDSQGKVGMVINSLDGGGGIYIKTDDSTKWSLTAQSGLKEGL